MTVDREWRFLVGLTRDVSASGRVGRESAVQADQRAIF
jgi:hypothetical protein